MTAKIRIGFLYPELLNLYGDRGNVLVLARRALWRGIEVEVKGITIGDRLDPKDCDLIFLGGGADQEQAAVAEDLKKKAPCLVEAVARGAVLLSICGGYQLLGKYYRTSSGLEIPGIGIFQAYTLAGNSRLVGNVAVRVPFLPDSMPVVGFENHSGRTFIQPDQDNLGLGTPTVPLGRIVYGSGNNGSDGTEGARRGNAFGTYLHGPLLAKNPHLADYLLSLALESRYGEPLAMTRLDDTFERAANREVYRRFRRRLGRSR
ncbi:MAG: type 1 glutamine amidotransferase [Moorellales bacterium]